jgi:hypothetical protein
MSLFDRLARVATGKALLWTKGGAGEADDAAVRAELEALRPSPREGARRPSEDTARPRPRAADRAAIAPRPDPAEHPVPRTDLLGEPDRADPPDAPQKKDL